MSASEYPAAEVLPIFGPDSTTAEGSRAPLRLSLPEQWQVAGGWLLRRPHIPLLTLQFIPGPVWGVKPEEAGCDRMRAVPGTFNPAVGGWPTVCQSPTLSHIEIPLVDHDTVHLSQGSLMLAFLIYDLQIWM